VADLLDYDHGAPAGRAYINLPCTSRGAIFEFALWARRIAILGALVTQFHEMSGLATALAAETEIRSCGSSYIMI
jgi:hypothetical protein